MVGSDEAVGGGPRLGSYESSPQVPGRLQVLIQLALPPGDQKWTELDATNQQTLEELQTVSNTATAGVSGYVAQYRKARRMVVELQQTLTGIADTLERMRNLLNWTHPPKTAVVYCILLLGCYVTWVVPFRYLFLTWAGKKFHR